MPWFLYSVVAYGIAIGYVPWRPPRHPFARASLNKRICVYCRARDIVKFHYWPYGSDRHDMVI
jgi:hypothetical protein